MKAICAPDKNRIEQRRSHKIAPSSRVNNTF